MRKCELAQAALLRNAFAVSGLNVLCMEGKPKNSQNNFLSASVSHHSRNVVLSCKE